MGGRGTGKTTLLYFLKAALSKNAEEDPTTYSILKNNLGNGTINVELEAEDGRRYRIVKTLSEEPQPYLLPSLEYVAIDKIFDSIECDIYEASKIELIGRSDTERIQLIDKLVGREIKSALDEIEKAQSVLAGNGQDIKTLNKRILSLMDALAEYDTAENDFERHVKNKPLDIKEGERIEFEKADLAVKQRAEERRYFAKAADLFDNLLSSIGNITNDAKDFRKSATSTSVAFPNADLIAAAEGEMNKLLTSLDTDLESQKNKILRALDALQELNMRLESAQELQQAEFVMLKQQIETNKEYFNQYHTLSKRIGEKDVIGKEIRELGEKKTRLEFLRKDLIRKNNVLKESVFKIRHSAIKKLNIEFAGDIIVELVFGGMVDEYRDMLRNALRGSGMRYNELVPRITSTFSPDEFAAIIQNKDQAKLSEVTEIGPERASALINVLHNSDEIFLIESLYCNDLPQFLLRIDEGALTSENYKKAEDLSMGQRCTTVLPIVFAVSNNPLFIDQPEDNLDNKYISDRIHEIIRKQKASRQLIFITHNPNIPVLGDAESNLFLFYKDKKSKIDMIGNVNEVKGRIMGLLEGGAVAFQKRKELYGL